MVIRNSKTLTGLTKVNQLTKTEKKIKVNKKMKKENKISVEKENLSFNSVKSYFKYMINTNYQNGNGNITEQQYKEVFQKFKGKLSTKKSNISIKDFTETNIFFVEGGKERKKNKENQKYQNIKKIFKKDFEIENEIILNNFWVFWKHNNLINKWNNTKKYIGLFIKGNGNKDKLRILFNGFLRGNIGIYKDFIIDVYQYGNYKTITKKKINSINDIKQDVNSNKEFILLMKAKRKDFNNKINEVIKKSK